MNEEIEALLPFYALGALDEAERAQVEAYLAEHPEVRPLLEDMRGAAEMLPFAADPVQPSSQVKERVMTRVNANVRAPRPAAPAPVTVVPGEHGRPSRRRPFRLNLALPALAGLAIIVALVLGGWVLSLNRQVAALERRLTLLQASADELQAELLALEEENRALASQISTTAGEIALLEETNEELRRQLQSQEQVLAILTSPESQTVAIGDTGAQPGAHGSLTIHDATQTAVVSVANLNPLEQDRDYQLWLIQDGEPVSAGVFEVDGDGRQTLLVPYDEVGTFDAIGVSIEPKGGSEEPTGDIVLLEELSF